MKKSSKARRTTLVLPILSLLFGSCVRHRESHVAATPISIPAFFEAEPNDTSFDANDMGLLLPGDLFLIEGSISDSGFDPFDGFIFTSGAPVHVDFRLFIDNQLADFDVLLYDPAFDEVVGLFETSDNPELGGVDVDLAFVEFHLVVSSFIGSGTYALEIDVQPLYLREAGAGDAGEPSQHIAARYENSALQAEADQGLRKLQNTKAFSAYRRAEHEPSSSESRFLKLNPVTGESTETLLLESFE